MTDNSLQSLMEQEESIVARFYRSAPKTALNIFGVMMPVDAVRAEFTTWRDEQLSWRNGIALHDQSYHMHNLRVRGKDALALFSHLGINSFATFQPGAAKQFIACSPEGYVIGDAILYYLDEEDLLLVTDGLVVLHAKTQQHGVLFPRNQEASSLSSRKNHTGNIPSPP